jgi:YidC/Oxa1 family membrane protein insertase
MPVFIIMYQLIRGLTVRDGGLGSGTGQILAQVQKGVETTPWIFSEQVFHPEHLNPSTALYQALSQTNKMNFLGMDLSLSASQALKLGLLLAIPYLALLGIMLATGLFQNHQLQSRNTSANVNPQQQMIMKFMPFFLPVFSFAFPAGMALYWCTQNFCRIGTNSYITRSVYRKEHEKNPIEVSSKETKAAKSSKAVLAPKKSAKPEPEERTPGNSVKSQAAHKKQSGQDSTDGITSSTPSKAKVNPRRSGESRRGSQTKNN